MPEALKNMLVVMAARGVLTDSWKVCTNARCLFAGPHNLPFCENARAVRMEHVIACLAGCHTPGPRCRADCSLCGIRALVACGLVQDAAGESLWDLTWARAREVSSGLSPQLLAQSGVAPSHLSPSGRASVEASPRSPVPPALAPASEYPDQSPSELSAAIQAAQRELAAESEPAGPGSHSPGHDR